MATEFDRSLSDHDPLSRRASLLQRLHIDGMVDTPVELSFDDLVAMGLDEYAVTLTCVSNEVGGGLVGNAVWLGVPLRDVLRREAKDQQRWSGQIDPPQAQPVLGDSQVRNLQFEQEEVLRPDESKPIGQIRHGTRA